MGASQVQRGERGRWPKKKTEGRKPKVSDPGRRNLLKRGLVAVGAGRALQVTAGFIAWSEPKDNEEPEGA